MATSPVDDIKQAFEGFTGIITEVTSLVNQGPADYPGVYSVITAIHQAILPVGYSLLTLYFLLDFMTKSMNFAFFRMETVVSCLLKLVFAKLVMEHALDFLEIIFHVSSYISSLVGTTGANASLYKIDFSAMEAEYNNMGWFDKKLYSVKQMPFEWILQGIKMVIALIVFGRLFQLLIYTAASPIPIAAFIHDGLVEKSKRFVYDYAAVCLQGVIIIIGCIVYVAIIANVNFGFFTGNGANVELWKGILTALALLLVVIKSGAWARKIMGD
ncbi:hypothetical protein [Paenibacillus brasilensis]|uniref:hypothetical protein n=1 Tax=Paenibacillus brasilensis TaxID=128574 RepID=UPI000FAF1228|nr:hypothetical protein [Paenibacillus brasilensis]